MDITEIQKDKKIILRPFDNVLRLTILHLKEIEKLLEKQSKKETWRAANVEANFNRREAQNIYKFKANVLFYNKRGKWII